MDFQDSSFYEYLNLIFSRLSCIRRLVCDTSFRHIQGLKNN